MPRTKSESKKFTFAVGRRKEAVARIRLFKGKGENVVNDRPIENYFPGEMARFSYLLPFKETGTEGKYFTTARIIGGGSSSQLGAFIHGLARALSSLEDSGFRQVLKKRGLLTRDARTRERRKVGTGGKARRKKQSPKR